MPCDNQAFAAQYRDTLLEISSVLTSATNDEIVIGGDFNTDFSRTSSHNTQTLNEFIDNEELLQCDTLQYADIPYTFASKINGVRSYVDHSVVSDYIYGNINLYETMDDGDNLSDHLPVTIGSQLIGSQQTFRIMTHQQNMTGRLLQQQLLSFNSNLLTII